MAGIRTAVIGVGHFGQYHAEKLARLDGVDLVAVADCDGERARSVADRFGVAAALDHRDLLGRVDAVSIATPPDSHAAIARSFLEHGAHVLVEKPITDNLADAESLVRIARERNRILQVGHLERFSSVGRALRSLISRPIYIDASRIGPYKAGRGTGVNAVLDLMIHDLDLVLEIVNSPIETIDAVGAPVLSAVEDIANSRLQFANGCVANLTVSRVSVRAERIMKIFEENSYASIDFLNKTIRIVRRRPGSRPGTLRGLQSDDIPYLAVDSLQEEIRSFIHCVRSGEPPEVSGEDGCRALAAALRIVESLQGHWQRVREHDRGAPAQ
ncbi:MAG: Gfo/Idh/MocA family oxidoreductase [Dongiaceae bacterium]